MSLSSDRISGKVCVVTGAAKSIGFAIAEKYAEQGAKVVLIDIDPLVEASAKSLADKGYTAKGYVLNITNRDAVLKCFADIEATYGDIYALVNNAGVVDVTTRVDAITLERLRRMFEVNVFGSFLCAREAVRRMSTRYGGAGGAIVNVSSAASRLGSPGQYVDYAAAKGAIDAFTIGLAKEVGAEGIRVNAVRPGLIETEIHASGGLPNRVQDLKHLVPMQRGGTADEVAQAIVWLLSDAASYTTMSLLDVSGGR
ncbi:MAG TPA: NAD(P)-dependent oxidoreductase [Clostridiales bacterium]|nr:NAD(P)-dependent oxidoreductase [Clostridiales bacterium]